MVEKYEYLKSNTELFPKLVVNDSREHKKVLTVLLKNLKSCKEFYFSVAFVTKSGIATIINTLGDLEKKGIKGKVLVSQYQNFTQPEALAALLKFKNIQLRISVKDNFHAKGYFFCFEDKVSIMVGSSNLTAGALCSNKEWNLLISPKINSKIVSEVFKENQKEFEKGVLVTEEFIDTYRDIYLFQNRLNYKQSKLLNVEQSEIMPNKMQIRALKNIKKIRDRGGDRALLISATGTGKTYLSAFDVKNFKAKKALFIVHRKNIAKKAMESYKNIFKEKFQMGLFSGDDRDISADYIFTTIQTISKEDNLNLFKKEYFDYIIIDETHRASAPTYQRIIDYFNPKFLLGMTATPERSDSHNIFQEFNYNIAYEIRLEEALREKMLVSFHYYGVSDIGFDEELEFCHDGIDFNSLTSKERVNHIIEKSKFYGTDSGIIRCLVFCSRKLEAIKLAKEFNKKGFNSISLTGDNTEKEREESIKRLELPSNNLNRLEYIFTVDIFNEGIDIPKINQIIMIRPTQSAIIFIQQLGRGLRKSFGKEYLTVIDFIGNYQNNYFIPIALYGDNSFDKSKLKKLLLNESLFLPANSTVNFDEISKERIFRSLDAANLGVKKDLIKDYNNLKFRLGRTPMMLDFINTSSRNPKSYIKYSKSYYNFVINIEKEFEFDKLENRSMKLLECFSSEIGNDKRIEDILLMINLIYHHRVSLERFNDILIESYGLKVDYFHINSICRSLNFHFSTEKHQGKLISIHDKYQFSILKFKDGIFTLEKEFLNLLKNKTFKKYLLDLLITSKVAYEKVYKKECFYDGFLLYEKYSRKDVIRILRWEQNEVAQGIAGYKVNEGLKNCPVFITYYGDEQIYEHGFLSREKFKWMSKAKRTLNSPDMLLLKNEEIRVPLFIKKSDDEGIEFFYVGELIPKTHKMEEKIILNKNQKEVNVVSIESILKPPIQDELYNYFVKN